ncbi:MAG: hypothetical protein ACREWE_13160, partial [Gammaproteobacteria bacterium]
ITPTDPNAQIGQRNGLSAGDIAAVQAMYPTCIVKQPWREPVKQPWTEPVKQPWREPGGQFKKLLDDRPWIKKLRDDPIGKMLRDPKLPRDPGPIKRTFDPMPIGRPEIRPGTLQPFSLATPHHAIAAMGVGAAGIGPSGAAGVLAGLEQQLLELEAAIAQARATAAQANAEAARLQETSDLFAGAYEEAVSQLGGGPGR